MSDLAVAKKSMLTNKMNHIMEMNTLTIDDVNNRSRTHLILMSYAACC